MRPLENPVTLTLPDGPLTEQARAVVAAVAGGELAPGEAASVLQGLVHVGRLVEIDELTARVAKLEERHGDKP